MSSFCDYIYDVCYAIYLLYSNTRDIVMGWDYADPVGIMQLSCGGSMPGGIDIVK